MVGSSLPCLTNKLIMSPEGCMVVELLDYRPPKGKDPELHEPKRTRVVLNPTPESLWADICMLNQKAGHTWTDHDALQVEAKILVRSYHSREVCTYVRCIDGHRSSIMPGP